MSPPYTVHVFCRALYAGSGRRCDNASVDGDHATKYGSHPPTHMLDLLDQLSLLVLCWKCVSVCFRFLVFVLGFWHYFLGFLPLAVVFNAPEEARRFIEVLQSKGRTWSLHGPGGIEHCSPGFCPSS